MHNESLRGLRVFVIFMKMSVYCQSTLNEKWQLVDRRDVLQDPTIEEWLMLLSRSEGRLLVLNQKLEPMQILNFFTYKLRTSL